MNVTKLHDLVNTTTSEILGEEVVLNEDLSNVVDIGKAIIDSNNVDNYVKKLVNHIGKVVFVDRKYDGSAPSVMMDSWEFGSILQKVSSDLPNAVENESFDLTDGHDYSPDVFYKPSVSAKFFNSKITFEISQSFTERQVKESFSDATQLNGFISMLLTSVENSMTVKVDSLIMRTVNNMTAETLFNDLPESGTAGVPDYTETGSKAINLLKMYNTERGESLTKADCLSSVEFIKFAVYKMGIYSDRLSKISTLFNVEGKERFTPKASQNLVLLADFAKANETFVLSGAQNKELLTLPTYESVPYWQGSGTDYAFGSISKLDVKTSSGDTVSTDGILGVIFDRNALGVTNLDRRVTTNYNPKAEFYTNFNKFDAGYFNDLSENFLVFFVG